MGVLNLSSRTPFASVNLAGRESFREGWVKHHVAPLEAARNAELSPFLLSLRDDGFHIDDFATNGILLPTLASLGRQVRLPIHHGGHPNYNARMISELQAIRVFCESIRSESRRRSVAISGLRGWQERARSALLGQGANHVDHVILKGFSDSAIDAMIDRALAGRRPKSLR